MQASNADIQNLLKLQALDMELSKLQKSIDELPQKQEILQLRHKKQEISVKRDSLVKLDKDNKAKLNAALLEDKRLQEKSDEAQHLIDTAAGDFRSITIHSKELSGYTKRRETLSDEIAAFKAKQKQIEAMETQIEQAFSQLNSKEEKLIESYKAEGRAKMADMAKVRPVREQLAQQVNPQILASFERIAKSKNGVALCALSENSCSVCRASFDGSRVLRLRSEAPLSTCPSCGRMMIVQRKYVG